MNYKLLLRIDIRLVDSHNRYLKIGLGILIAVDLNFSVQNFCVFCDKIQFLLFFMPSKLPKIFSLCVGQMAGIFDHNRTDYQKKICHSTSEPCYPLNPFLEIRIMSLLNLLLDSILLFRSNTNKVIMNPNANTSMVSNKAFLVN